MKKTNNYTVSIRNSKYTSTMHTVDTASHGRKRRALNSVFSDKAVRSAEDFIIEQVDRWCEILLDSKEDKWTMPKNMGDLSSYLSFDVMGTLSCGKSFGLEEPDENPFRPMLSIIPEFLTFFYAVSQDLNKILSSYLATKRKISQSPLLDLWWWLKPRVLDTLLEYLSPPDVKRFYDFNDTCIKTRIALLQEWRENETETPERHRDLLYYLFEARVLEIGEPAYSERELYAEAELLVLAGTDTIAVSLASFFFTSFAILEFTAR
jgi:cytochrome P450